MVTAEDASSNIGGVSLDSNISSALRSVVSCILLENGIEDVDDISCVTVLEQVLHKFICKNSALTQAFAEHSMRLQAHFSDAVMALAFTGADIAGLKNYFKEYKYPNLLQGVKLAPETAPAQSVPTVFQSGDQKKLPKYIPDYFPPMPSVYTFESTPVQKQTHTEYKQVRDKYALERRQVEDSLIAFHLRVASPHLDSPFQLPDNPRFSLLPSSYGLDGPAYLSALVPSKFEDRRREEITPSPEKELDVIDKKREREDDETMSLKESEQNPRKYRKQNPLSKRLPGEKRAKVTKNKSGLKSSRRPDRDDFHDDQSNSTFSAVMSPG